MYRSCKAFPKALAITLAVFLLVISCSNAEPVYYPLYIGDSTFQVELARTPQERSTGLMYRRELEPHRGMLFIFDEPQMLSFWMKNTYIDLSIAYIDSRGVIVDILDMEALREESVPSSREVLYALELRRGVFDENGIFPGDTVDFSDIPLD